MLEPLLFLGSAIFGSGILFAHKRVLTYIALAGVLFESELLLTSAIHRVLLPTTTRETVFLVAGIVFCTLFLALYKQWKSPYEVPGSGVRDGFVGIAILLVAAFAYPILQGNGFVGEEFVLRGFYNGDGATLISLVQKSFDTTGLVTQNPFAANGSLEYPTLLHGALADTFSLLGIGKDWIRFLSVLVYLQIFLTIPMLFLVWDAVWPEPANPAEKWFGIPSRNLIYALQTLISLWVIGLSVDAYTFPQSHVFLMGIFLGAIALLYGASLQTSKNQLVLLIPGSVLALLLLFSNTVTGTAAAMCMGALAFLRVFDKKRSIPERAIFLFIGAVLLLLMKWASDGRTGFMNPHFSVSSGNDMIRAGVPALFILGAALFSLSRKQYIAVASILVSLLSFLTFFLSDRNIVTENASRFFYHGVLVGFPLLLPLLVMYLAWVRRELLLTLRPLSEIIAAWIAAIALICIILLPVEVSTGSTYISLLKQEPYRIPLATRTALWWLDEHAGKEDVIIASPDEPYVVPVFTGRSVLRLYDYWLSPQDDLTKQVVHAFAGNKESQDAVVQEGSYLVLNHEENVSWNTAKLKKVFEASNAIIYKTR